MKKYIAAIIGAAAIGLFATPAGLAQNRGIIHHVSLGGPDIFPPGVDRNFSLVANMDSQGKVSGQWQDTFGTGQGMIHAAVDCLVIDGNKAIIGGVITRGTFFGVDVSGQRVVTMVVDNGTTANDPRDQVSFSFFAVDIGTCGVYSFGDFPLFDVTAGQVKVW